MPSSTKTNSDQSNHEQSNNKVATETKTIKETRMIESCHRCRSAPSGSRPSLVTVMLTICFILGVGSAFALYQLYDGMERTHILHNAIEIGHQEVYDRLEKASQVDIGKLEKALEEINNRLYKRMQEYDSKLEKTSIELYVKLEKGFIELYGTSQREHVKLFNKLERESQEHYNNIEKGWREQDENLGKTLQDLDDKLEILSQKLDDKPERKSQEHHDILENALHSLYDTLVKRAHEQYEQLRKDSQELKDTFQKTSQDLYRTEKKISQEHIQNLDKEPRGHNGEVNIAPQETYDNINITNQADYKIRLSLDHADSLLDAEYLEQALQQFNAIVTLYPESPRGWWGHARATRRLAKQNEDNNRTGEVIESLKRICYLPVVTTDLLTPVLKMLYDLQLKNKTSVEEQYEVWGDLYKRYPDFIEVHRIFGDVLIDKEEYPRALTLLHQVVDRDVNDGVTSGLLGWLYYEHKDDFHNAAKYLQHAIDVGLPKDGTLKYRYHLLTVCYNRLNETQKEHAIVDKAVNRGFMISRDQRSMANCGNPYLPSRPWWTIEQTSYQEQFKKLEDNWETIRDEAMSLLDQHTGLFQQQTEGITEKGDWKYLLFYRNGKRYTDGCKLAPKTCALFDNFTAATSCTRGQVKLSIMQPGIHVWPHCGPTNCRIRAHLGLVVPEGPRIKVGNETRTWTEGKIMVFDDSFLHEVWHDGQTFRMILIIDVWHPDLTQEERDAVKPM